MSKLLRKFHSSSSGLVKRSKDVTDCANDRCFRRDVPKGYLPVYVGKDVSVRYVIEAKVVNHPLFAQLLQTSVEEFGYEQTGALRIPCDIVLFETILNQIKNTRVTSGLIKLDIFLLE
ncbi:auxin-responsive protein SAUR71-like [Cryptomeria japonica]|uniref:auxin-responsive protein SAUR71-like n=1 Tax=Cryptomeria japonica TaxID=3369 RepID=UPI0025ACD3FF|nr:auxin-responsive protein SAUR71-like [Cryptomeria japonica]